MTLIPHPGPPQRILDELREATGLHWQHRRNGSAPCYWTAIPGTDHTLALSLSCDSVWIFFRWEDYSASLGDDEREHLGASVCAVLAQWADGITARASERLELAARLRIAAEGGRHE